MSAGIWVIHTGAKSGCKMLTLFDSYSYDGVTAGILVIHTGAKSGCKMVTLFDSYPYDGLIAATGVQHRQVPNLGVSWSRFLAVTLMMV